MCISSDPRTTCWKDGFFPIEWSWHTYWKSVEHRYLGFFPGFWVLLHSSICCFLYQHHIAFMWWSKFQTYLLCSKYENWEMWVLQFHSSVLRLFWLFWVTHTSHIYFGSACLFLQRGQLGVLMRIALNLYICLGSIVILTTLSLTHELCFYIS